MTGPVNPNRLAVGAVAAVAVLLGGEVGCRQRDCPLHISTESRLPTSAVGAPYFVPLEAGVCDDVVSDSKSGWELGDSNLPPGLRLSRGGDIDGVPGTAGEFSFLVEVRVFFDNIEDSPTGSPVHSMAVKTFFLTIDPMAP